jgi:hypothetical protein
MKYHVKLFLPNGARARTIAFDHWQHVTIYVSETMAGLPPGASIDISVSKPYPKHPTGLSARTVERFNNKQTAQSV